MQIATGRIFFIVAVSKLSMYSGTLALGIGDSMASIVGKLHGRIKWPGTIMCMWCVVASCSNHSHKYIHSLLLLWLSHRDQTTPILYVQGM